MYATGRKQAVGYRKCLINVYLKENKEEFLIFFRNKAGNYIHKRGIKNKEPAFARLFRIINF